MEVVDVVASGFSFEAVTMAAFVGVSAGVGNGGKPANFRAIASWAARTFSIAAEIFDGSTFGFGKAEDAVELVASDGIIDIKIEFVGVLAFVGVMAVGNWNGAAVDLVIELCALPIFTMRSTNRR